MAEVNARKNYLMTFLSGFGGAVVSTGLGLVSAPLSLSYWGEERFGLWAILLSVLSYLSVSNFGIGQAATTLIGKNNEYSDKRRILGRSAIALAVSIAASVAILVTISAFYPGWHRLLGKIPANLEAEAKRTSVLIMAFFFANLPFTLVSSALVGTQRAYLENVFQIGGTVANFLGLVSVILLRLSLPWYAVMNGLFSLALNAAKAVVAFTGKGASLRSAGDRTSDAPMPASPDAGYRTLLRTSARFFLIWLAATLVWNTDNFVVSNVIGLKEVTPYSITFKFYNLIFTCIFIVNNSLLPLMAKEYGAGNWEWISKYYRSFTVIGSSLGGLALVGGLSFGHDFVLLWTGPKGYAGTGVLVFLGLYSYLLSMVNFNSGIINTFNYTKGTWLIAFAEGGTKIGASILLGRRFGLPGIAAGTMLGSFLAPAWICPIIIYLRSQKRLRFQWKRMILHFIGCVAPCGLLAALINVNIKSTVIRILLGIVLVFIYCLGTFFTWPMDIKKTFSTLLSGALNIIRGRGGIIEKV